MFHSPYSDGWLEYLPSDDRPRRDHHRRPRRKRPIKEARRPAPPQPVANSSYRSTALTKKETERAQSKRLRYGYCAMQGWRVTMEDAHNCILSVNDTNADLFAIYDGHGGTQVADLCAKDLPQRISNDSLFKEGNIAGAIENAFVSLDHEILDGQHNVGQGRPGSTACVVVLSKKYIVCGSVGDSRCLVYKNRRVISMTEDHKPSTESEKRRITNAGGFVVENRVNGMLAMSRAIGDIEYKKNAGLTLVRQAVTPLPDVRVEKFNEDVEFIVIACDGIWEVLSEIQVAMFVKKRLKKAEDPARIAKELIHRCLHDGEKRTNFGRDNMSVIIIQFNHETPGYKRKKAVGNSNSLTQSPLEYSTAGSDDEDEPDRYLAPLVTTNGTITATLKPVGGAPVANGTDSRSTYSSDSTESTDPHRHHYPHLSHSISHTITHSRSGSGSGHGSNMASRGSSSSSSYYDYRDNRYRGGGRSRSSARSRWSDYSYSY